MRMDYWEKCLEQLDKLEQELYDIWDGEAAILQQDLWQDWKWEQPKEERKEEDIFE